MRKNDLFFISIWIFIPLFSCNDQAGKNAESELENRKEPFRDYPVSGKPGFQV